MSPRVRKRRNARAICGLGAAVGLGLSGVVAGRVGAGGFVTFPLVCALAGGVARRVSPQDHTWVVVWVPVTVAALAVLALVELSVLDSGDRGVAEMWEDAGPLLLAAVVVVGAVGTIAAAAGSRCALVMGLAPPERDPFACAGCGYDRRGLAEGVVCPECGGGVGEGGEESGL